MEQKTIRFLKAGIIILFLMGLAFIYFFTLGYDEAWLLSYYQEIYNGKKNLYKLAPNSTTAGGVFVLFNVILFSLFGASVAIFRFVSYFSFCGIAVLLWSWSKKQWSNTVASLIVLSCFLGMQGTIELSGLLFADFVAMLFCLLGLHLLIQNEVKKNHIQNVLLVGLFFGLASTTRLNLIGIFPAIFCEAFLFSHNRKKKLIETFYIILFGVIVFLSLQYIIFYISPNSPQELLQNSIKYVGLTYLWLDYPRILNKWVIANGFLPFYLMAVLTLYTLFVPSKYSRVLKILMLFGWIHWVAWMIWAPISHLRYLWPTLGSFSIIEGFALASLYMWAKKHSYRILSIATILIALAILAESFVFAFRALIHGESDILMWEWSRETPLSDYRWLRYQPNQRKMAQYLAQHRVQGEEIGVFALDLQLEILSGAKLVPLSFYFEGDHWATHSLPERILMPPMVGKYLYLDPALSAWMKNNLEKEVEFGDYTLYQLKGSYPEKSDIFHFYHSPLR